MKKSLKHVCLAAGLIAVVGLTACGGGGDGGTSTVSPTPDTTPNPNPTPDTTPNPNPNPNPDTTPVATADAADRYAGSYVVPCSADADVMVQANGAPAFATELWTFTKTSANVVSFVSKATYYDSTDSTCSGRVLGEQTNSNPSNSITFDGQKRVTQGSAMVMMDKATMTLGKIGGLSAGNTITINGLVYPGNYFSRAGTGSTGFYLVGNDYYPSLIDENNPPDAAGYPTAVRTFASMTKQ